MIILDTHVWIWHVQGDTRLKIGASEIIQQNESIGIGVSAVSLWEVAKTVQLGRLSLPIGVDEWFAQAISYPRYSIVALIATGRRRVNAFTGQLS